MALISGGGLNRISFLEFYNIPGWNRSVSIEQYGSIEELYNHFQGDPVYPYVKFEVYPLRAGGLPTEGAEKAKSGATMKFLVLGESKDIWYAMSAEERRKIEEANSEHLNKLVEAGDILVLYEIPGWNRTAAIEHFRNIDELYNHFAGHAGYPYTRFEIYPLIEADIMN